MACSASIDASVIFIADEHDGVRDSICSLLTALGLSCEGFSSVEALLQRCGAVQPACVFVGRSLFAKAGCELRQELGLRQNLARLIVLTDDADVAFDTCDCEASAYSLLTTPLPLGALHDAVSHAGHPTP